MSTLLDSIKARTEEVRNLLSEWVKESAEDIAERIKGEIMGSLKVYAENSLIAALGMERDSFDRNKWRIRRDTPTTGVFDKLFREVAERIKSAWLEALDEKAMAKALKAAVKDWIEESAFDVVDDIIEERCSDKFRDFAKSGEALVLIEEAWSEQFSQTINPKRRR